MLRLLTAGNHQGEGAGGDGLGHFWHGSRLLCGAPVLHGGRLALVVRRGVAAGVGALHALTSGRQLVQMFRETS